jgi:cell pole-organizing protein PopZ
MSDPKSAGNDPSMDDILASIRKIISDDEARAQVSVGPALHGLARVVPPGRPILVPSLAPVGAPVTVPASGPASEPRSTAAGHDDVLLLTDLIDETKTDTAMAPAITLPRIDPIRASEMPQPSFEPPPSMAELPAARPPFKPVDMPPVGATLIGDGTASSTASAFARLNQAVEDSVLSPVARDPGPAIGGGKTVEDLVREMLRPMLQEWLDRNLPQMVERLVEKEIVRLTRR